MDKKISDLNAATALTGTEVLPIVQGGETKKVTAKAISELGGAVSIGQVAFGTAAGVIGGDALLPWDNVNKRLGVGTSTPTARLHVQAPGALSTDIGFLIQNSTGTANVIESGGNGSFFLRASTGDMHFNFDPVNNRIHLKRTGIYNITTDNAVTALQLFCNAGNASLIGGSNRFNIINGGNFHFEEVSGVLATSGAGAIVMKNRIPPSTNVVDRFYLYSADIVAGNAAPHFRTENGSVIKLYKQDLPTNPTNAEIATFLSNLGMANLI
jgi:hypothetical protein